MSTDWAGDLIGEWHGLPARAPVDSGRGRAAAAWLEDTLGRTTRSAYAAATAGDEAVFVMMAVESVRVLVFGLLSLGVDPRPAWDALHQARGEGWDAAKALEAVRAAIEAGATT